MTPCTHPGEAYEIYYGHVRAAMHAQMDVLMPRAAISALIRVDPQRPPRRGAVHRISLVLQTETLAVIRCWRATSQVAPK